MTRDEFMWLRPGDMVRSKVTGEAYVVTANHVGRVTAVRTADVTNPPEWDLVQTPRFSVIDGKRS